jgi:hypothetical protein
VEGAIYIIQYTFLVWYVYVHVPHDFVFLLTYTFYTAKQSIAAAHHVHVKRTKKTNRIYTINKQINVF